MCGIAGILRWRSIGPFPAAILTRICDLMRHHVPDDSGVWVSPHQQVGLGFRRLAIVDLSSAANQPMSNEDDTLHVVFNGEIYKHAELWGELIGLGGHRWKTDPSDTEVILHAFERGIACLERFRGLFAILVRDMGFPPPPNHPDVVSVQFRPLVAALHWKPAWAVKLKEQIAS